MLPQEIILVRNDSKPPVPLRRRRLAQSEGREHGVGLDLLGMLTVLQKHWRASALFAATVLCLVAGGTFVAYLKWPTYKATVRLEIDPPGSEEFSMQSTPESNELDYVDTQAEVLRSDDLALAVIRSLRLDRNPALVAPGGCSLAPGQGVPGPNPSLSDCEHQALRQLRQNMQVTPIRNTRVLELTFSSHDPQLASAVANTLASLFVERNYRTRYEAVMLSSEWLGKQLEDIRRKMVQSNEALAQYQRTHHVVDVDEKQSTVTQQISELNRQLTQAQADWMQLEPYIARIRAGDSESLPQIHGNPMIQALLQRWIEVQAELSQAQAVFGRNSPNIQKLQSQANELGQQIKSQKQQIAQELETTYAAAGKRQELLARQIERVIGQMGQVAEYNNLKREAQATADLYNTLYARIKEAGISAASKSSNARVFDPARVLDRPTWPRPLPNILIGIILGVLGGVVVAFAKENMDRTVHTLDEVKQLTGVPVITLLPKLEVGNLNATVIQGGREKSPRFLLSASKRRTTPVCFFTHDPNSPAAEGIRSLRSAILLSRPGPPKVMLVASPFPGEGKTTVAVNLAAALANTGSTCLVDADMRNPKIESVFGLSDRSGLADVLKGSATLDDTLVRIPEISRLTVLPGGTSTTQAGELVLSSAMPKLIRALRAQADYVVIDSPPMLPYADARALVSFADGLILVARLGATTRAALVRIEDLLRGSGPPILAVVLNGVDIDLPEYQCYR